MSDVLVPDWEFVWACCVMSGNEEEEFRKMAEIADAINDILRADDNMRADELTDDELTDDELAEDKLAENNSPQDNKSDSGAVANGVISNFADAVAATDGLPEPSDAAPGGTPDNAATDKGLEAAIAAELAQDEPNGMAAVVEGENTDTENTHTENTEAESAARSLDSTDLAILSLRMRDTLAELKNEHGDNLEATEALMSRMEGARDMLLEELDATFQSLEKKIAARKSVINQEIDRIYQEIATTRSEMELMAARFQQNTAKTHESYNEIFLEERKRVERYREFLTFMLRERK